MPSTLPAYRVPLPESSDPLSNRPVSVVRRPCGRTPPWLGRSGKSTWSPRVYEDYPAVQGLYYASSMDGNRPAVALYERAQDALPARPLFHRVLADPGLNGAVARAALLFDYGVDP